MTPEDLQDHPSQPSPTLRREDATTSTIFNRGHKFLAGVYRDNAEEVLKLIDYSGTEDLGLIVRLLYGYILSNTAILSPVETSFVLIAAILPQDVRYSPY